MRLPTLKQFFRHQLQHGFGEYGLAEPATVEYVSDVLTRFAHTRSLYAVHDRAGRPLCHVADMLAEWHGPGYEDTPDRHRQASVARHVGEYTLFMSGLFRERLKSRGELDYYMDNGRNAFLHCAHYELNPKRQSLFRGLHFNFKQIANTLDYMVRIQFPFSSKPITADTLITSFWRT